MTKNLFLTINLIANALNLQNNNPFSCCYFTFIFVVKESITENNFERNVLLSMYSYLYIIYYNIDEFKPICTNYKM